MAPKGVRRAAVALGAAALFLAGTAYAAVAFRNAWFPFAVGSSLRAAMKDRESRWSHAGRTAAAPDDAEPTDDADALAALGYAASAGPAPATTGVVRHVEGAAWPGAALLLSAHAPEAHLVDLDGKPLHRWARTLDEVWPGKILGMSTGRNWRRVRPLDDGSLLVIFERAGIARLDRESRVVWAHEAHVHHDVDPAADGRLAVLAAEVRRGDARIPVREGKPLLEDVVLFLDPATGERVGRVSVLEALLRSPWAPLLAEVRDHRDLLHTNTVAWLDGSLADRVPAFARGNLLVCLRNIDTVAVLDPREERIVWAMTGMWRLPHDPQVVPPGRLLVFDNQGLGNFSRVIEVDPVTQAVTWSFDGNEANGFFSAFCGTCRRLPNGNTLIVETNGARAFEVTPGRDVVWEYASPHRAPDEPGLAAKLFDMIRLPEGFGSAWLRPPDER